MKKYKDDRNISGTWTTLSSFFSVTIVVFTNFENGRGSRRNEIYFFNHLCTVAGTVPSWKKKRGPNTTLILISIK